MKHHLYHITRRAVPLLLLAAICAAAWLYADGVYSFTFLQDEVPLPSVSSPLPKEDSTSAQSGKPATPADTAEPQGFTPIQLPPPDSLRTALNRNDVIALCKGYSFSPYTASSLAVDGFVLSTEPYDVSHSIFAKADGFPMLPDTRSYYDGYKTIVNYVRPDEKSAPVPQYSYKETEILAVQLYMGLVLVDDGYTVQLYNSDGTFAFSYTYGEYSPAYTRDKKGNPVFTKREIGEDGAYYDACYIPGEAGMIPSDYDDELDGRGLYFDYPPSYGIADNNLMRLATRQTVINRDAEGVETVEEKTLWAFAYSQYSRLTGYKFTGAFDFSEDLAAVLNEEGHLYYLGKYGYQAFNTLKNYYYYERYVTEYLLPPLTSGIESLGFYYYDHGLVRVRRQVVDWYGITYIDTLRVAVDEDVLINKKGEEFPIPAGFDIVAYSDGVILLEKDGKYGYMDHTGQWITQPIFEVARPFIEGCAVAGFHDGTTLMIDTAGNVVIPAGQYYHISDVSSGVVSAWNGKNWEIFHKMARFG
ncbi:MAG: WG repeat-containing protein [Ruminococcaceae bacterium]|nr:WG repeat-containing protein [Oscillospiraceae bacterium]